VTLAWHHWTAGVERGAPDTDHIQHAKKYTVQARQHVGVLHNFMDDGKPPDEAFLGAWRWLAFALAQRPHNSNNDIGGYSLGGVEVLEQCCYTRLVQMCLHAGKLHDGSQIVFLESISDGMPADDMDDTRYLDGALLCRCPGRCRPLSALLNWVQPLAILY
jgi:hypothetical protein